MTDERTKATSSTNRFAKSGSNQMEATPQTTRYVAASTANRARV